MFKDFFPVYWYAVEVSKAKSVFFKRPFPVVMPVTKRHEITSVFILAIW